MSSHHKPSRRIKTYLFLCNENKPVYRILASRDWKNGDTVTLPPLRVSAGKKDLYGGIYVVYLYKVPKIYGSSGYLPKKKWRIKQKIPGVWKLKPVKN